MMRRIVPLINERKFPSAVSEVTAFLSREMIPEVRSDALGMRANLNEHTGDLEAAAQDLLTACSLVVSSYGRYVHELSLAGIYRKREQMDDSLSWCRTALRTCLECEGISGGSALTDLLLLCGRGRLAPQDQDLCERVARRSWAVLGLPGEPDVADLSATVSEIKRCEANPPRKSQS